MDKNRDLLRAAIAVAAKAGYDVLMYQEPIHWAGPRNTLPNQPGYEKFSPVRGWRTPSDTPRVVTYVRKGLGAQQLEPPVRDSRDLLLVKVRGMHFLNFYRGITDASDTWSLFLNSGWTPPASITIGGDFNATHTDWDPSATQARGGDEISDWMGQNGLTLTTQPGQVTHQRHGCNGTVIDLVYSTSPNANASVNHDAGSPACHFPIAGEVPTAHLRLEDSPAQPEKFKLPKDEEERAALRRTIRDELGGMELCWGVPEDLGPDDIDWWARTMVEIITNALRRHGTKCKGPAGNRKPWWNKECAEAHKEAIRHRKEGLDETEARKEFRRVVRRTIRNYWRRRIDSVTSDKELYDVIGWRKLGDGLAPPPITHKGQTYHTDIEKGAVLRQAKLAREPAIPDLEDPWSHPVVPRASLCNSDPILRDEARYYTIEVDTTAPGGDGITIPLLKLIWQDIEETVTRLFDTCRRVGHHPQSFRKGDICMIPKEGKDPATAAGYRPIQLLNVLGKGLERLMARRTAHKAMAAGLFNANHIGALPGRSAIDLTAAFIDRVETWLAEGKQVVAVMNDVKGAFDAVLHGWFIFRLRQQGWDDATVRWWESFATGREARVRFGSSCPEHYTPLDKVGLPQGSPASPIGYALSIADMHHLQGARFGYADDSCHAAAGRDLDEAVRLATEMTEMQLDWCAENGVQLDAAKAEAQIFSRRKALKFPTISVPSHGYTVTVAHKDTQDGKRPAAVRWLGMYLDRQLKFDTHVEVWARKGLQVATHIRGLAGASFGPSPGLLRRTALACVPSVALFGAEIWYEGQEAPRWGRRDVIQGRLCRSPSAHLLRWPVLRRTWMTFMRAILPAWKTFPADALHRESGVPAPTDFAERIRLRYATRIATVDAGHPVVQALQPTTRGTTRRFKAPVRESRIKRVAGLVENPPPRPILTPPRFTGRRGDDKVVPDKTKEEAARDFKNWTKRIPPGHTVVYSDGSQRDDHATWAYTVWRDDREVAYGRGHLHAAQAFDGEARGARMGLEVARSLPETEDITCCIDNQAVIKGLAGTAPTSSQLEFLRWQEAAGDKTTIRWSPAHCGIAGNERANELCSDPAAYELPADNEDGKPTVSGMKARARDQARQGLQRWHESARCSGYPDGVWEALGFGFKTPKDLKLPRTTLSHLLQARTGHGDFEAYHVRFRHADFEPDCTCGHAKTPEHIAHCRKVRALPDSKWPEELWHYKGHHRVGRYDPEHTLREILTNGSAFAALDQASGFFTRICPRQFSDGRAAEREGET